MSLISFSSFALTRSEMKNVIGGGTCAFMCEGDGWGWSHKTLSLKNAKKAAYQCTVNGYRGRYCCDNCPH